MIVKILQQGQKYSNNQFDSDYIDSTMDQVIVYAYYPTRTAPIGTYNIYLMYSDSRHKIGTINYEGTYGKWIVDESAPVFDLETKGQSMPSFEVYTKYVLLSGNPNTLAGSAQNFSKSWRFVVYFKTKNEIFEGIKEDPNLYDQVTEEFCKKFIETGLTLGAVCPKPMHRCLNWQRNDIIGMKCRSQFSFQTDDKKKYLQ